jgi:uncharacterized protein (DUF362 family)
MSRVALVRGEDRYDNVRQALDCIAGDLDLSGKQRVLIKPNFVVTHHQPAATHVDAVRAVLDLLRERYDGPITVAEGPAVQTAAEGFASFGYGPLVRSHGVTLADLNDDEPYPVQVYDWKLRPLRLHLARSVVESDFRISVSPPKTHDVVIVTLGLKNMIMGSLISRFTHSHPSQGGSRFSVGAASKWLWHRIPRWVRRLPPAEWLTFRTMSMLEPSDKMKMHQSYPVINLNLALLAPVVMPHLSVIDGFEGMEGLGPSEGDPVPWRIALAGADALAVDVTAATLMGFDPDGVGYLHYCKQMGLGAGDPHQIEIAGNATMAECARPFRPHPAVRRQRRWRLPGAESYLRRPEATLP